MEQIDQHRLYTPRKWNSIKGIYSCRAPGVTLPLVALQYSNLKIKIELRDDMHDKELYDNNEFILSESYKQNILLEKKRKKTKENSNNESGLLKKQKIEEYVNMKVGEID
jgi:hypothetical protein